MRLNAVLAVVALFPLACSTGASPGGDAPDDFAAAQQRWEAADLENYRFDFQQQCFCVREQVQPVTIEVRAGQIVRVLSRENGAEVTTGENLRWYTVPDLFRIVGEARQNGITPLVVQYDAQRGYPAHIEAGSLAADAGVIYTASNLQPLTQ